MLVVPGKIVLEWDSEGHLAVNAPLAQKDMCYIVLAKAIEAIVSAGPKVQLPVGIPPKLRNL